jgi:hypothetical protein
MRKADRWRKGGWGPVMRIEMRGVVRAILSFQAGDLIVRTMEEVNRRLTEAT